MRLEITNLTGLTLHTAATGSHRSVAVESAPVTIDREAWDHTIRCAPSFGRMVERGVILVRELDVEQQEDASPSPGPDAHPAPTLPDVEADPVDSAGATVPDHAEPEPVADIAPPVTQPRQQGGGKRRR